MSERKYSRRVAGCLVDARKHRTQRARSAGVSIETAYAVNPVTTIEARGQGLGRRARPSSPVKAPVGPLNEAPRFHDAGEYEDPTGKPLGGAGGTSMRFARAVISPSALQDGSVLTAN